MALPQCVDLILLEAATHLNVFWKIRVEWCLVSWVCTVELVVVRWGVGQVLVGRVGQARAGQGRVKVLGAGPVLQALTLLSLVVPYVHCVLGGCISPCHDGRAAWCHTGITLVL